MTKITRTRETFRHLTQAQMDLIEEILGKYSTDDLVGFLEYLEQERVYYEKAVERYNRACDEMTQFAQDLKKAEQQVFDECLDIAREVADGHTVVKDLRHVVESFTD